MSFNVPVLNEESVAEELKKLHQQGDGPEIIENPDEDSPKNVRKTRRYGNRLYVAGEGPRDARVMLVATALLEEEAVEERTLTYGKKIKEQARYLKGPTGAILTDLMSAHGLDLENCYYTALCKWLLPRSVRLKPKKEDLEWGKEALINEIREVKPDVIVCFGKPVFDMLTGLKLKMGDVAGGWFSLDMPAEVEHKELKEVEVESGEYDSENNPIMTTEMEMVATDTKRVRRQNAMVYPMEEITKLVTRPEMVLKFKKDFVEIRRTLDKIDGVYVDEYEEKYEVIRNADQLQDLVSRLAAGNRTVLSVDCEWHLNTHVDGLLRSLQISWAPGEAAYIRFMDAELNYVFDVPYKVAGAILGQHLDKPETKYVGHHISADLPWMHHVLGLKWYKKAFLDTEFAEQCVDEHQEMGLERLGMHYTDLGRYDLELTLWKKKNAHKVQEGYGLIPDEILIPYATKDVDVVIRSYPKILKKLQQDPGGRLMEYYFNIFHPFVTDVFTSFAINGLPMDQDKMDELRDVYNYARREMSKDFRERVTIEANQILEKYLREEAGEVDAEFIVTDMEQSIMSGHPDEAFAMFKKAVGVQKLSAAQPVFDHFVVAPEFNIRSTDQMRRWLFKVKGYKPIKSTNNKEKGLPSMPWEKVEELPEERRKDYKPSTDKQSLEILKAQHQDPLLDYLIMFNAVGNICKGVLKEADLDEEGEVVKENGLHKWLASDGKVHGQTSTTETGRPRSWKPNTLNWPGWVNDKIVKGIGDIMIKRRRAGELPSRFNSYLSSQGDEFVASIPSVRSCVRAPAGWCLVESDYQTAEIRGLAFISGDEALIDLVTKPDPCFVRVKPETAVEDGAVCRVGYPKYLADYSLEEESKKFLMAYGKEGEIKQTFSEDDLLKKEDGSWKHYKHDLHWSLAEMVHKVPREKLHNKRDRGAAKVGNFSSAYGATGNTLERKIESDTGIKPAPGTGEALLQALAERQPRATAFLLSMEEIPETPGYITAASGRTRHFHLHDQKAYGIKSRMHQGMLSAMGRECRNFPMQESVASTAARAGNWLLEFGIKNGLQGRPMTILYDSVVALCPEEEREIWSKAHEVYMFLKNGWSYHGRVLTYPIDTELNQAWSAKPSADRAAQLNDPGFKPTPERFRHLIQRLESMIGVYSAAPKLALRS